MEDIDAVKERAMEWAEPFFRDSYRSAPPAARRVLSDMIAGRFTEIPASARRWLSRRYLLTPEDRLSIPLFGAWLEHNGLTEVESLAGH